jgi:hypothetical protein
LQDLEQALLADTIQHAGGFLVGRVANHIGQGLTCVVVQGHVPFPDLYEGTQQDGNLRHTGGINHGIAVHRGHPWFMQTGNINQDNGQSFVLNCPVVTERADYFIQLPLQHRVMTVPESWISALVFC